MRILFATGGFQPLVRRDSKNPHSTEDNRACPRSIFGNLPLAIAIHVLLIATGD